MLFVFFKIWKIKLPVVWEFLLGIYRIGIFGLQYSYFCNISIFWLGKLGFALISRCLVVPVMGKIIPGYFGIGFGLDTCFWIFDFRYLSSAYPDTW